MRHWSVIWFTVFCFHLFCCCCSLLFIMSISSVVIVSVDVMQCASLFPLIPVRALRSVDQNLLMATHTHFHTRGDRSFQAVAPSSLEPSSTLFALYWLCWYLQVQTKDSSICSGFKWAAFGLIWLCIILCLMYIICYEALLSVKGAMEIKLAYLQFNWIE